MPRVLVADDNEEMLETLERIFLFYQFDVEKASNGKEAIEIAERTHPDLILMDGMMPEMDGFEACKILKTKLETKDIPIVFLTANYIKPNDRITGFELGADDYLLKPFNSKELVTRSKAILKRNEMLYLLKSENQRLADNNVKIQDALKKLLEQSKSIDKNSFIDRLTGLYNFNFFERRLKEEVERANRYRSDLSLVLVTINNLDRINETFGYQIGNYIVIKMANSLLNKTRTSDILARSSDDLFHVILPQTDKQGAYLEAERIRIVLSNNTYLDDELIDTLNIPRRKMAELRNVTVNLGVATFSVDSRQEITEKEIISRVQQALKKSISSGNDKTAVYEEPNG